MSRPDYSILLLVAPNHDSEQLRRSLVSLALVFTTSEAEVTIVAPAPAADVVNQTAEEFGALAEFYENGGSAGTVNRAFRNSTGNRLILLTAGTMWSELAGHSLIEQLGQNEEVLAPVLDEIRPLVDFSEDDLLDLARGGLSRYPGSTAVDGTPGYAMLSCPRRIFWHLRGLDEKVDNFAEAIHDLSLRARRMGRQVIRDGAPVKIFRVAERMHTLDKTGRDARPNENKGRSYLRNLTSWGRSQDSDGPLVSIVISTYNRAEHLRDCIHSILVQSFKDFELVLIDDGSTDDTMSVVESFGDARIRYFPQANTGIAAARNFGTQVARGAYIAVHDDDDLMLPWRLESQLAAMDADTHGNFGVSVHFDDETGEMSRLVHRRFNMKTALRYGHNPTHPTWMIRSDIFSQFGYDETLKSGVDNNLALRMVRSGINLKHTGEMLILRRIHGGQITRSAGEIQNASASMTRQMLKFANAASTDAKPLDTADEWLPATGPAQNEQMVRRYLPDHLVSRVAYVLDGDAELNWDEWVVMHGGSVSEIVSWDSETGESGRTARIDGFTWSGMADLSDRGIDFEVLGERVGDVSLDQFVHEWVQSTASRTLGEDEFQILLFDDQGSSWAHPPGGLQGITATAASLSTQNSLFISKPMSIESALSTYGLVSSECPPSARVYLISPSVEPFSGGIWSKSEELGVGL